MRMSKSAFYVEFTRIVAVGPFATKCAEFVVNDGPLHVPIADLRDIETAFFVLQMDPSDEGAQEELDDTTAFFDFLRGHEDEVEKAMEHYRALDAIKHEWPRIDLV